MIKTISTDKIFDILTKDRGSDDTLLNFISNNTRTRLENDFSDKDTIINTISNIVELQEIWKHLLIEAIQFLKINDSRERAFLNSLTQTKDDWEEENKTNMSSEGAYKAASLYTYGIEELYKYFQQFTKFESILYGSDHYYRDHVLHPLLVWLIGLNILDEYGIEYRFRSNDNVIIEKSSCAKPDWFSDGESKTDTKISTAEFVAMWTIAALTHDLGYPLEKVDRVNDQLEQMLNQFGKIGFTRSNFTFQAQHDHLVKFLLKIISSSIVRNENNDQMWYTHISPKYLAKFSKSWEMFEHGIVSSLILLRSQTYFLETDFSEDQYKYLKHEDSRQFSIRSEILHAIAAHTTKKVYHLAANTLPFLLVLCDELQEWKRPTMSDLRAGILKGSAEKVDIKKCKIDTKSSDIHCCVHYYEQENHEAQKNHVFRVFKSWHERLRPAVFDTERNMIFEWEIFFKKRSIPWRFTLDTSKPSFLQVNVTGPLDDFSDTADYDLYQ